MKWPFFCWYKDDEHFWFRILGYGLSFTKSRLSFSERNGYKRVVKISKNWRVNILKRRLKYEDKSN